MPQSHHKPVTNPTSTKATIYEYTTIGLVVLIHLLDDHPRHIRYREALRKNADVSGERREVVDRGGERGTRVFTPSGPHIDRGGGSGRERRGRTPPPNIHTQTTSSYRTEERRLRTPPPPPPPPRRTTSSRPTPRPSLYYLASRLPPPERTKTANISTSGASQYLLPRSSAPNKERPQERRPRTPPSPPPPRRTNLPRRSSSPAPPSYFIRHVRPSTPDRPQHANGSSNRAPRHPCSRTPQPNPSPPLPSAFRTRRSSTPDLPHRPPTLGERKEAWTRIRSVTPSK
jgi:hypothetical protein